jgi:hypothetical protein
MARAMPIVLLAALVVGAAASATTWLLVRQGALADEPPWTQVAGFAAFLVPAALGTLAVLAAFAVAQRALGAQPAREKALRSLRALAVFVVLLVAAAGGLGGLGSAILGIGLVGFGLTLALQRPILSVAAWANIRLGRMFQEGDRIEVAGLEGDVLEIRLLTTRLWEVGAPTSRTPGRPTGRMRIVSNALFLEQPVANATSDTATIFDEFAVTVAYEADIQLAKRILRETSQMVVNPATHHAAAVEYQRMTRGMSMERHFPKEPVISMHLEPDWIELRLRYLVDARQRGAIRSALAQAWQDAIAPHAERLPNVYRRMQVQATGADGRVRA